MTEEENTSMGLIVLIVTLVFLVGWAIYALTLFRKAKKEPASINVFRFQSIPTVFTTLGVLGTFVGIAIALIGFNIKEIDSSISELLAGMRTAFWSSVVGITGSLVSSWWVKDYLHRFGSQFPVPESDETAAMKEVRAEIEALRKSFVNTNEESARQLLDGIQDTNNKLVALGEQAAKDSKAMVKTLNDNHKLMEQRFAQFADLLAEANTEALREAMEKLIRDFSNTFSSLIESLVNQNFEQLNKSVEALNNWQKQHREEVDHLHQQLGHIITSLGNISDQLNATTTRLEQGLANTTGSLDTITAQTKRLVDDDSRLAKIVAALEATLVEENKLTQAFDKAVAAMEDLQAGTEEFEQTKRQVTEWLNREKGISSAMTLFNDGIAKLEQRLAELDKIKTEDIKLLDNNFDKRIGTALNTSFSHLDRLLKEYLQFLEQSRKIEISVTNKEQDG